LYKSQQVAPGVFEIIIHATGTPPLPGMSAGYSQFAAWFLSGETPTLIEPGPTVVAKEALQAIEALGYDPDAIQYLVPTHVHVDHGGGCGWVAQQLPRLKVAVHSKGARHLLDPSRLIQGTAMVFGERWEEGFGPILPVPADRLLVQDEGDALPLGGRRHRFYYAPGHAPHHWAIFDEERRILYCGEAMGLPSPDSAMVGPPTSPPLFEVEDAMRTIEKLSHLDVAELYYSHHGHGTRPVPEAMAAVGRSTKEFAQIIREGFQSGQDSSAIDRKLQEWCERNGYPARRSFGGTIQPFLAYFKRQAQSAQPQPRVT